MKTVLIVTYYFPPRPGIGSVRLRGLAKYLPEYGWKTIILTPKLPGPVDPNFDVVETPYFDIIWSLRKTFGLNINESIRRHFEKKLGVRSNKLIYAQILNLIFRSGQRLVRDIIFYPDEHRFWYSSALRNGCNVLRRQKVDAILSSSSPTTVHLVAKSLKEKFNLPWIADLRDPWTQNYYHKKVHSSIRRLIEKHLEIRTLSRADALTTVSQPLTRELSRLHKSKTIYSIPNGFDPEEKRRGECPLTEKFTITHTGSLHRCLRDPSPLFDAVKSLISEGVISESDVEIRFYGKQEDCLDIMARQYGLEKIVKQYGIVERAVSLERQRESQLLLLLNWSDDADAAFGTYTGKIFEYLAAQRPILAIGRVGGCIEELLNETSAGKYLATVADIKAFLSTCYQEYKSKGKVAYSGQRSKIDRYSQREMAKSFSQILESCCSRYN